jgi:signal transduction histidine kinase
MMELIDRLLTYARAGERRSPQRPVDLALATDHVVGDLAATIDDRQASVVADLDGAPPVLTDAGDVEMLLRNLISNAVKFGSRHEPQVRVSWQLEDDGDLVRVAIDDDGDGIAPGDQARIFRAFERLPSPSDARGTGLGLSICQRIVERAGGAMGVRSARGEGSSFWFTLPVAREGDPDPA